MPEAWCKKEKLDLLAQRPKSKHAKNNNNNNNNKLVRQLVSYLVSWDTHAGSGYIMHEIV